MKALLIGAACLLFAVSAVAQGKVWKSSAEPLAEIKTLRSLIKAPAFKKTDYLITKYGAVSGGMANNTKAINAAIDACSRAGGGRVIVPVGTWLTGAIYLKSNVNLHLADSAKIIFSRDTKDYPIVATRWEGMECMNYSALIYADGETNIAITGNGTLDGNADREHWWNWVYGGPAINQVTARNKLHDYMHQKTDPKTRVFGDGSFLRPNFIQFKNSRNIRIADVKITNSPMWIIHPLLSENIIVENVKVISHGPNNDGCDPESCKNVLIRNCLFDTGDDCIAIKSGRDEDGRRVARPAENHIIENCMMKDGHGGVSIGSEIAGGARNIYAINNIMDSKDLDRVLRLKTSSSRGGIIENVFMKDTKVGTYKDAALSFNMFYETPGNFMPTIRNIWVENLDVEKGGNFGVFVHAYPESPVQNLRVVNSNIRGVKIPVEVDHVANMAFDNVKINGTIATAINIK
ncbi:glycoside hydrolase family 28 protein [Mucilaginibacter calamicampi]|uniref:Glycoside hydrolase family 28 protein n=1 Tax=Mucilaginibacter calamicampi TaxID=1302352 RepID=A0ABW2Z0X8_9SPHI